MYTHGGQTGSFCAPERLIEQADVLATAEGRARTDVLIDALRAYLDESAEHDRVKRAVANAYFEGTLGHEEVKAVLGPKEATNLRVLKTQLEDDDLTQEIADL